LGWFSGGGQGKKVRIKKDEGGGEKRKKRREREESWFGVIGGSR
jgi:hypothetical protein